MCVQPLVTSWSRRTEDLTVDKTDEKDAVLIARLTAQLRCYVPEPADETWGRLRHLGTRREQLITEAGSQIQQMRDLLECAWPAALDTARQPFRSATWIAALPVIAGRDGGDFARTRRLGAARFERAVRREITRRGGQKPCLRIVRGLFAALADPAGVIAHRPGALERVQLLLEDWQLTKTRLADTEQRMTGVLDELGLTALVTSITGLSRGRRGGDPGRDRRPPAVRHRPRAGQARRPGAAGETVRRVHRPDPADRPGTPRAAAGSLARGLGSPARQPRLPGPLPAPDQQGAEQAHAHPGADRHRRRDLAATARRHHHRPGLGSGHRNARHPAGGRSARRLTLPAARQAGGRGEPSAALRHPGDLGAHHGQPRPSSPQPDHALQGQTP